ncbi:uncharacterized protein LOC130979722 [Arachis stenosperma]|uniref:uncharacterized protein LOC130979722 n=1 Tax=Arachis stenosperma TaxID=217475 RepID=UPI0025AB62BC|nr:uncharacterized protein LOC130979722 [Arachis stenosperma]
MAVEQNNRGDVRKVFGDFTAPTSDFYERTATRSTQDTSCDGDACDPDQLIMKEVNYMGKPYGNTYNFSWRNHPNLSWKDQQKPQQGFNNNQGGRTQNRFNNRPSFPYSQQQMEELRIETRSSIRNFEVQVGQLSKRIPETPPNSLPSNTEVNPREECKAITVEDEAESEWDNLALNASKEVLTGRSMPQEAPSLALNANKEGLTGRSTPTNQFPLEELKATKAHEDTTKVPLNVLSQIMDYKDHSFFNEEEETREEQVTQYLGLLMKLNAKFFGTGPLEEEPLVLTKELNTLVQAARISLEIVDKLIKKAYGLVEDVLVKVENLYIPADFIILDTGEEEDESIILGRPFLATVNAIIDVAKGELIL